MKKQTVLLSDINETEITDEQFLRFCKAVSYPVTLTRKTELCVDGTLVSDYRVEANTPDDEFLQDDLFHFFMQED